MQAGESIFVTGCASSVFVRRQITQASRVLRLESLLASVQVFYANLPVK